MRAIRAIRRSRERSSRRRPTPAGRAPGAGSSSLSRRFPSTESGDRDRRTCGSPATLTSRFIGMESGSSGRRSTLERRYSASGAAEKATFGHSARAKRCGTARDSTVTTLDGRGPPKRLVSIIRTVLSIAIGRSPSSRCGERARATCGRSERRCSATTAARRCHLFFTVTDGVTVSRTGNPRIRASGIRPAPSKFRSTRSMETPAREYGSWAMAAKRVTRQAGTATVRHGRRSTATHRGTSTPYGAAPTPTCGPRGRGQRCNASPAPTAANTPRWLSTCRRPRCCGRSGASQPMMSGRSETQVRSCIGTARRGARTGRSRA